MKKSHLILISLSISLLAAVFALGISATIVTAQITAQSITATLDPNIIVRYNDDEQSMYDANGNQVFPINYNGTVYLPVRAFCDIFGINIEWIDSNKNVLINDDKLTKIVVLGDFEIKLHDDEVILTKYLGEGGDVVIPDGITIIGQGAFDAVLLGKRGAGQPDSVYIPDSVRVIEKMAFFGNYRTVGDTINGFEIVSGLKSVRLPSNLESIGKSAFADCAVLTDVTFDEIPERTITVGDKAFAGCTALENCGLFDSDNVILDNIELGNDVFSGTPFVEPTE